MNEIAFVWVKVRIHRFCGWFLTFFVKKFVQYSGIVKWDLLCYRIYTIFGFNLKYTLFRVSYGTVLWQIATDFQMLR